MARVITNVNDFETWESAIDGVIWVKKFDRLGDVKDEQVKAHGKLVILPEERRYNQEMVAESHNDPFQNGFLVPVKLVESAEDFEELTNNPNHLTEADMKALFKAKNLETLRAKLAAIENPSTLQRVLAIAESEEVDATVRQVAAVKARISDLSEAPSYTEIETIAVAGSDGREVIGTAAPKSSAPRNPGMGRR